MRQLPLLGSVPSPPSEQTTQVLPADPSRFIKRAVRLFYALAEDRKASCPARFSEINRLVSAFTDRVRRMTGATALGEYSKGDACLLSTDARTIGEIIAALQQAQRFGDSELLTEVFQIVSELAGLHE